MINVTDIIKILSQHNKSYFLPNYTSKDDEIFIQKGTPRGDFKNFVAKKDKLNISIPFRVFGEITLKEKDRVLFDNKEKLDVFKHRNKLIMENGKLLEKEIIVATNPNVFNILTKIFAKFDKASSIKKLEEVNDFVKYKISFEGIPEFEKDFELLNQPKKLLETIKTIVSLESKQSVVNAYVKRLKNNLKRTSVYSEEQFRILETYNLTGDLEYKIEKEKTEKEDKESFKFTLKGMTSIPSITKIIEDRDLMAKTENVMYSGIKDMLRFVEANGYHRITEENLIALNDILKDIKEELRNERLEISKTMHEVTSLSFMKSDGLGRQYYTEGKETLFLVINKES